MMRFRARHRIALAAIVLWLAPAFPALAGEQSERALAVLRQLIAAGEVKRDAVLKLGFKQGNVNALLGPRLEIQKDWEQQTGIVIAARVIPQQPAHDILQAHPDIDLTVARNNEYPDLVQQGAIADLGPLLAQYGFTLPDAPPTGYIRPALQSRHGQQTVAIPADGDVAVLYLRRDLLEDPQEREAFRKATGRNLAAPRTWKDYDELIRFFHRPQQGLYGTSEERNRANGAWFWLLRYLPMAESGQALFDERMRPTLDAAAALAATESYVAGVRAGPPGILDEGKDYGFTLPLFMQGKAFATIMTIAGAKLLTADTSAVRDKFVVVPLPGHEAGGRLVRRNTILYGNNLVVSSRSANRKLALLFALWLTDPDRSLQSVGVQGGFTDPYRWHHLKDARISRLYSSQALETLAGEWAVAEAPGTGLPGNGAYLDALGHSLWLAGKGEITPAEAMRRTAAAWNQITDRLGRERQAEALRILRAASAPAEYRGAAGR